MIKKNAVRKRIDEEINIRKIKNKVNSDITQITIKDYEEIAKTVNQEVLDTNNIIKQEYQI